MLEDCRFALSCTSGESATKTSADAQRGKTHIMLLMLLVPFCWPRRTGQRSVRTSDLGWTSFSMTWFPGSLVEGEPEHAAVVHPCSSSGLFFLKKKNLFATLPLYGSCAEPSCCNTKCRCRTVSSGTTVWCCWFWVEQLAPASPPEPLNLLSRVPVLHMPST